MTLYLSLINMQSQSYQLFCIIYILMVALTGNELFSIFIIIRSPRCNKLCWIHHPHQGFSFLIQCYLSLVCPHWWLFGKFSMMFIFIPSPTYMLRRNKFPPLPGRHDALHTQISPQPHQSFPQAALSPNPPSRLQRKREESVGKSSSLNCKLQRRNVQTNPTQQQSAGRELAVNNDYYPSPKQAPRLQKIQRSGLHSSRNSREGQRLLVIESAPVLAGQWDREKREEEMSTELSKHSECLEVPKQVRFGGIVEGKMEVGDGMKKREKLRSPSILKNGRNILNGSLIGSKERERSCSVASGRGRTEKQEVQNNTNKIIKQKYRSILAKLQTQTQVNLSMRSNRFSAATYQTQPRQPVASPFKYKDEIFPPVASSIFAAKKGREKIGQEIGWMRLSNLFKGKELTLVGQKRVEVTRSEDSYAHEYLVGALNCLAGSPKILQRIFEGQGVNSFGIYLMRIYQESVWKYIIIDDYIPVVKTGVEAKPAFLNIRTTEEGPIDIWPFLLEKAYANYYSRYQALQLGSLVDFVQELSGTPSRRIQLRSEGGRKKDRMLQEDTAKALLQVRREIKSGETLTVGELFGDRGNIPLVCDFLSDSLSYYDPYDSFRRKTIAFDNLAQLCRAVHIISPFKFQVCSSTIIRKGRPMAGREGSVEFECPSVRTIKIETAGEVAVSLRQREKRLFHLKQEYGEYIWCRFLLLQRQGQHGFRWISGEYTQCKAISFIQFLQPGQYWLLVEPEWRPNSPSQLTLHLYARGELPVERALYRPEQRVIESACLDLAQRYGQLNQINKFICSYNYVSQKVGLIIQNIVNERVNGDVTVMRSIRGLKCKVQILPVNREFYEEVEEGGEKKWKLKEEIELDIPKGENFTVVLKLKGGIDRKFFKSFDFGC